MEKMYRLALTPFCLLLLSADPIEPPFDNLSQSRGDHSVSAFIGTVTATTRGHRDFDWYQNGESARNARTQSNDTQSDIIITSTGGRGWDVRTKVIAPIHAIDDAPISDFWASSHYGRANYVALGGSSWLFFVRHDPDGLEHSMSVPAFQMPDKAWHVCGEPNAYEHLGTPDLTPPASQIMNDESFVTIDFKVAWQRFIAPENSGKVALETNNNTEAHARETFTPAQFGVIKKKLLGPQWEETEESAICKSSMTARLYADYLIRTFYRWEHVQRHCIDQQAHLVMNSVQTSKPSQSRFMNDSRGIRFDPESVEACALPLYRSG